MRASSASCGAGPRVIFVERAGGRACAGSRAGRVAARTGKCFAVVAQANRDLEGLERDVRFWYCALRGATECDETVLTLPSSESDPYAGASPHPETLEQRALTLWRLAQGTQDFVLLTARALARRTLPPEDVARAGARLRREEDYPPGNC